MSILPLVFARLPKLQPLAGWIFILFQNAFPTLEKYIDHVHTSNGAPAKVGSLLKDEILNNFKNLLKLKNRGYNVFFTDIDKIKKQMEDELK